MNKISILIPAYGVEGFIGQTIDSVKKYAGNCEVIIMNDGDKSKEMKREILEAIKGTNFKFIDNKVNKGLSRARNELIAHATGEYIFFLDGDDVLKPGFTEKTSIIKNKLFYKFDNAIGPWITKKRNMKLLVTVSSYIIRKDWYDNKDNLFIPNVIYEDNHFSTMITAKMNNKNSMMVRGKLFDYIYREGSIMHSKRSHLDGIKSLEELLAMNTNKTIVKAMAIQLFNSLVYQWKSGKYIDDINIKKDLKKIFSKIKKERSHFIILRMPILWTLRYIKFLITY